MADELPRTPSHPSWFPKAALPSFYEQWGRGVEPGAGVYGPARRPAGSVDAGSHVKAYLLILADLDRVDEVLEGVRSLSDVVEACRVVGPFDIVAVVEGEGSADLPAVMRRVREITGVQSASTATTSVQGRWKKEH